MVIGRCGSECVRTVSVVVGVGVGGVLGVTNHVQKRGKQK